MEIRAAVRNRGLQHTDRVAEVHNTLRAGTAVELQPAGS